MFNKIIMTVLTPKSVKMEREMLVKCSAYKKKLVLPSLVGI